MSRNAACDERPPKKANLMAADAAAAEAGRPWNVLQPQWFANASLAPHDDGSAAERNGTPVIVGHGWPGLRSSCSSIPATVERAACLLDEFRYRATVYGAEQRTLNLTISDGEGARDDRTVTLMVFGAIVLVVVVSLLCCCIACCWNPPSWAASCVESCASIRHAAFADDSKDRKYGAEYGDGPPSKLSLGGPRPPKEQVPDDLAP